jgi:hypothetical protein
MDDVIRDGMLAKFAEAKTREAEALQRLQTHGTNLKQVRAALGNPYFYSGRSADDPQSKTHFTGYKSHEPGLQLIREWQDVSQQVTAIRSQLRDAGIETGEVS